MPRLLALLLAAALLPAAAQPLPERVIFDDFDYATADWTEDAGTEPSLNQGSLFGWNPWRTSLASEATVPDRLWYRGFSWSERRVPEGSFAVVPGAEVAGTARGAALFRTLAGSTGPVEGEAQAEVTAGFLAREGTWAARVNFSDLRDVRGLMQSFWAMSVYTAVVRQPDGALVKQRSEIDHEFNNWFHLGWTRDPAGGPTLADQYLSDNGGVFEDTGYFEGGGVHLVPMHGPAGPGGRAAPEHACTLVRRGEAEASYRLSPATCADLLEGNGPLLVYGLPVLEGDLAVDLLMAVDAGAPARFELRSTWEALRPDGRGTDRYELRMVSAPEADGGPGPSQPMAARFSQYVTSGAHGVRFGDRPLLRDHAFAVDWFFFATDPSLELAEVAEHVRAVRAAGVRRLNTTGRPLRRPYRTEGGRWRADRPAAAYINAAPARVRPGEAAPFVGAYAHRVGDLRVVWERSARRAGAAPRPALRLEDAWFRADIPFPDAGRPGDEVLVRLAVGEYGPIAFSTAWLPRPTEYASRTVTYRWDGGAWTCSDCAAAADPAF